MIERTELLTPQPAEALGALLDVPVPVDELPLLWHWLYLLDRPAQSDLGPDGHPLHGTVPAPPGPGRRRMWAGGPDALKDPFETLSLLKGSFRAGPRDRRPQRSDASVTGVS